MARKGKGMYGWKGVGTLIITIVGAGNSGSANAYAAAEAGHEVRVLETVSGIGLDGHFDTMCQNGGIWGIDNTKSGKYSNFSHAGQESFQKLAMVTRDPKEAIEGANVIMICILTQYHEALAKTIARYFQKDQLVILIPGYMGSIYYHRHCEQKPLFAEAESTPNDARISENGKVKILFKNVRNALSFLPADRTQEGINIAHKVFPSYHHTRKNIMDSALHNPNMIVHTVGMYALKPMMDFCAKYHPDDVPSMYRDALSTDFAWAIIDLLDKEKMDVLQANGCERISYLDACKFRNEKDQSKDSRQVFEAYKIITPEGPRSFNFRYITEDVPFGLVMLSALGKAMEVPTPTCDHIIQVVNTLLKRDFYKEGFSLKKLGVDHLNKEQLLNFLNHN